MRLIQNFEGKIVVTRGVSKCLRLTSVEAYDYYKNKWTCLPDIIEKIFSHAAVSMGNKMFIIGGENTPSCEVFDCLSRTFTALKPRPNLPRRISSNSEAFSIGNKIVLLENFTSLKSTTVYMYDVDQDNWS